MKPFNRKRNVYQPGSSTATGRWLSAGRQVFFALLVIIVFFLGLELVLKAFGVRPMLLTEDPLVGFAGNIPLFVEKRRSDGTLVFRTAKNKLALFNPQEFPKVKASNSYRIFCMGGSTTFGRPYNDDVSFCGWLRAFLNAAEPAVQWEVINAGGVSYASYRVARLMEEVAKYQPDLFIVYSGQNEFLEQRSYGRLVDLPEWVLQANAVLSGTRIYTVMNELIDMTRSRLRQKSNGTDMLADEVNDILTHTAGPTTYHRDDELKQQVLRHYRFNLERMVKIARAADADILFVIPAVNLKDMSPFKSEHMEGLSDETLNNWEKLYQQGITHYKDGRFSEALDNYRQAMAIDDRYAELHYRIGQTLFSLHRYDEAEQAFWRAVDEDIAPLRMLSTMPDLITDVANRYHVPLVNYQQILRGTYLREYGHAVFGKEYFLDHVHTNIEGYRLLGLALLDQLIEQRVVSPTPTWGEQTIAEVTDRVKAGVDRAANGEALLNLGKVFDWAGKFDEARVLAFRQLELLGPNASGYRLLGNNAVKRGNDNEAIDYYLKSIAVDPDVAPVRRSLGDVFSRQGNPAGALEQYQEALRIDPGDYYSHDRAGVLLAKTGDYEAADYHFRRALHSRPKYEPAAIDYVILLVGQKKYDEALVRGRELLRLNPDSYRLHNILGAIFAKRGDMDQAIEHFSDAVRLNPDYEDARRNLEEAKTMRDRIGLSDP